MTRPLLDAVAVPLRLGALGPVEEEGRRVRHIIRVQLGEEELLQGAQQDVVENGDLADEGGEETEERVAGNERCVCRWMEWKRVRLDVMT